MVRDHNDQYIRRFSATVQLPALQVATVAKKFVSTQRQAMSVDEQLVLGIVASKHDT
jgi:hypothetical protein